MTIEQTRQSHAACIVELRAQEVRLALLPGIEKTEAAAKIAACRQSR
jgi:hypothetical protein